MATGRDRAAHEAERIRARGDLAEAAARMRPRLDDPAPAVRIGARLDETGIEARWRLIEGSTREVLCDPATLERAPLYERSIEGFIGEARIPIGLAGPLRVNGLERRADYYVPLATHEATLVASYHRGMRLLSEIGGCAAWVVSRGVVRSPAFAFETTVDAGLFVAWLLGELDAFRAVAATTTRHGRLLDSKVAIEGNHVHVAFEFSTGDAAGQNMVTIATEAICADIVARSPVRPTTWFVEANMSGDKKASSQAHLTVRGRKAIAEAIVPAPLIEQRLHTTAARMDEYWRMGAVGAALSGTIGIHGHVANGLAALGLACGQDVATVAESAVGITRMDVRPDGSLHASVTLPNLIVGTVGGGTGLPTAQACLRILGLAGGAGSADAFAELCAATALAGELSITGAICAGEFTSSHARRARGERRSRKEREV